MHLDLDLDADPDLDAVPDLDVDPDADPDLDADPDADPDADLDADLQIEGYGCAILAVHPCASVLTHRSVRKWSDLRHARHETRD